MKIEKIKVTPKTAAKWLESNMATNRNIRKSYIKMLAADMLAGRWKETGETIKFNPMRTLIDGQHRLSAVVESGCTIEMHVAWDVPSDAIMAIDTGRSRSAADIMTLQGTCKYPKQTPTLIRRIEAWESKSLSAELKKRRGLTAQEIVLSLKKHEGLEAHIANSFRHYANSVNTATLTQGEWAFASWLLHQTDPAAAEDFLTQLSMLTCPPTSPIRVLFTKLTSINLPTLLKVNYIIRTWNAWRRGETQVTLKARIADEEKIPQPV
jgi:hypothetical protein